MELLNFNLKTFTAIKDDNEIQQNIKRVNYFLNCFIQLKNNSYCILNDFDEHEVIPVQTFNNVYATKLGKAKSMFISLVEPKNMVYEVNKPLFYDNNINLCPKLPETLPYNQIPKEIKENVKLFERYFM